MLLRLTGGVTVFPESLILDTAWTEASDEAKTHWHSLWVCVCVCVAPTCVWGITVEFRVLIHYVNKDDNQLCQADWIWNTDIIN